MVQSLCKNTETKTNHCLMIAQLNRDHVQVTHYCFTLNRISLSDTHHDLC